MTHASREDIEERLREVRPSAPPADLADRLKAEIPERPVVVAFDGGGGEKPAGRRNRWLLAASVAVALIGGSLAYQVSRQSAAREPVDGPTRQYMAVVEPVMPQQPAAAGSESSKPAAETPPAQAPRKEPDPVVVSAGPEASEVPEAALRDLGARERAEHKRLYEEALRAQAKVEPMTGPIEGAAAFDVADDDQLPTGPAERRLSGLASRLGVSQRELERRLRESPDVGAAYRSMAVGSAPPSTGGTAEPNDLPYGDMFFQSYGVNPFIDTEDDNLSTFGLDVDTGSYTMARSYLEGGHLPPPEAVRVEEMVNFFDYGDVPPPADGRGRSDFAIHAEGAPAPFADGPRYRLLRFNVRGREVDATERKPATLIFVVDVSGSMNRQNRLGLVKQSLGLLLDQLRSDDRVGLVVYGNRGYVLLEPSGDLEAIRSAIDRLNPGGSTNAEEGLVLGYELAERYFRSGAINRVVLCSDGVANVGRTGPDSILERIGSSAERGIELTAVGFGMGNYNDVLMEQLADRGDGNYAYVDALDEARRVFVENLTGTLQTIAREAKIQVEFNPRVVSRYRLLGYENRDIADEDFRDDTVDAGEIGAGHNVTALYEVKLHEGAKRSADLATLRLRYHSVAADEVVETAERLRVGDLADSWESASSGLRLASLVAEYAEILRRSFWAREGDLSEVFTRAQRVSAEFAGDIEVAEFVGLVGRASRLAPPRADVPETDE